MGVSHTPRVEPSPRAPDFPCDVKESAVTTMAIASAATTARTDAPYIFRSTTPPSVIAETFLCAFFHKPLIDFLRDLLETSLGMFVVTASATSSTAFAAPSITCSTMQPFVAALSLAERSLSDPRSVESSRVIICSIALTSVPASASNDCGSGGSLGSDRR